MARFLHLSDVCINLDTVRLVYPDLGKPDKPTPRCMVTFVGSGELHGFYGKDAELLLSYLRENAESAEQAVGSGCVP